MLKISQALALGVGLCLSAWAQARPCSPEIRIVVKARHGDRRVLSYAAHELRDYGQKLFHARWRLGGGVEASFPLVGPALPEVIVLSSDQPSDATPGFDTTDGFSLRATRSGLVISGRNDRSVLYGVYELVRSWGVRFHLSGDQLPTAATCTLPDSTVSRQATLHLRGVHPYPDFLAGPSSWDLPQYEAYLRQLPKLGLNFFGIHQYTYEPYVDYSVDGVHPRSGHLETSATREWGYGNVPACEFEIGREFFPGCVWGSKAALGAKTPDERYARAQAVMAGALKLAHDLGLVTAFGFEPLSNDPEFAEAAKTEQGLRRVTAARIDGVVRAFPELDYLWLFADESHQMNEAKLRATYALIQSGERHLKEVAPAKHLMIGGWNIERTLREYDQGRDGVSFLPDTVFTSYGNYDPWRTTTENRYALFKGMRHRHSIAAWCEYDGRLLAGLQPNVTAYERMTSLMRDSGSLGFFFLHWNTRLCDANLEYLSRAGWTTAPLGADAFYAGYFASRFGVTRGPVESMLRLESLNKSFAYGATAFWLMADDWTPEGPWRVVAEAVERVRHGDKLTAAQVKYLRDQARQARELAPELSALEQVDSDFDKLTRECRQDCDGARFLDNRVHYYTAYLRNYVKLSLAVDAIPDGDLSRVSAALDLPAWLTTLRLYTRFVDDRGEKGIVVSLNQKILAGLRRLERALR